MITMTSVDQDYFQDATYDDARKGLKRIAEYDFANPKNLDIHGTNLMHLMLTAYKEESPASSLWGSFLTDVQYLLMFPRRRSEIAHAICTGGGGRECVLKIFRTLVKAAYIRSKMMGR